jgi:hypothetical protein
MAGQKALYLRGVHMPMCRLTAYLPPKLWHVEPLCVAEHCCISCMWLEPRFSCIQYMADLFGSSHVIDLHPEHCQLVEQHLAQLLHLTQDAPAGRGSSSSSSRVKKEGNKRECQGRDSEGQAHILLSRAGSGMPGHQQQQGE